MISRTRRSTTVAALATATLAVGLVGCAGGDGGGDEGGGSGNLEDSYTVATDSSFVPFEFEQDGEHVGFDMDIVNAIADEVGFDVNLEVTNFDGIIPGLQTGSFDIAIAGITITDERKNAVDFTDPYYKSGTRIAVPESNDTVEAIEDLGGLTVASRLGSAPLDYLAENVPDAEALPFEQLDQMYLAVEGGSATRSCTTRRTSSTTFRPPTPTSRSSAISTRLRTTASPSRRGMKTS